MRSVENPSPIDPIKRARCDSRPGTALVSYLGKRQDNFLLLRIIAAVAVIYGHSFSLAAPDGSQDVFLAQGWGVYSGILAVDVFFVVSGFMVSGSYLARQDFWHYAKARLLRIVPAYVAVLAVCALAIGPMLSVLPPSVYFSDPSTFAYVWKNLRFTSDMAWTLPGVFEGHRMTAVNGALWTLPAEMRMYMLVAVLGLVRLLRHWVLTTWVVVALGILGTIAPSWFPLHPEWFRVAGFFIIGILFQLNKHRIHVRHTAMAALAVLAIVSVNAGGYRYALGAAIAYFCFWFAYRTPCWQWLNRQGDPSYGTYLWGWPVQQVVMHALPEAAPWQNFVISACVALPLGYVSWFLIEKPALRLKEGGWRAIVFSARPGRRDDRGRA